MARELKDLGFRFVGPTTAYATMQAIGLVDDHVVGCFAPPPVWPEANSAPETRPKPEPESGCD
jgi:Methyladenine glycosylase